MVNGYQTACGPLTMRRRLAKCFSRRYLTAMSTVTTHRPLHTTGRLASRMNRADIADLQARLEPLKPNAAFLAHPQLEVELGIGNGMALYERAKANPAGHYLGAELYLNGLAVLVRAMEQHPLPNLRVVNQDGRELLTTLAPASVARLLVLFPDPWPKSKHHKRRLLQTDLLDAAARVLKPQGAAGVGEFWLVSDWPDYIFHAIGVLYNHPALMLEQTGLAAAACKPAARLAESGQGAAIGPHVLAQPPHWWQPTKYQQKAAVAGRAPWFLRAVNTR